MVLFKRMSRVIEGSLEILRPISVGAVKGEEELDDVSRPAPATQDDQNEHAFPQQKQDDDEGEESRTSHDHDEEEENGSDCDSFTETGETSASKDEEEDDSLIVAVGVRERAVINRKKASNEAKWQSKLQLLRKFRKQHGHCRVPKSYRMDGIRLGRWVGNQRRDYKTTVRARRKRLHRSA